MIPITLFFKQHLYSEPNLNITFCHFHFHKIFVAFAQWGNFMIFLNITQILREINFGDFRSAKLCHFITFRRFEYWFFWEFLHFVRAEMTKTSKFRFSKIAFLELLGYQNLISHKIWATEKCWNFHTELWNLDYAES